MEEIAQILPKIFRTGPLGRRRAVLDVLIPLWPRAAGKLIAQHSAPMSFRDGTLTIAAASPAWASQLRQMSPTLCAHLNNFLGAPLVRRLFVKHRAFARPPSPSGPEPLPVPRFERSPAAVPWSREEVRLDPELARIVETSFAKYFSRGQGSVN